MTLKMRDCFGNEQEVIPQLELYSTKDFMGKSMPGLAVQLYAKQGKKIVSHADLTVNFGEFIGMKNAAYINTTNCPYADDLLKTGIAIDSGLSKETVFCRYPLWMFSENFLREIGKDTYEEYAGAYDLYMSEKTGTTEREEANT